MNGNNLTTGPILTQNNQNHNNLGTNNNAKYINVTIRKAKTFSSGFLLPSNKDKKYNRVGKNGLIIQNIDINDDIEELKKDDTESNSTDPINKRKKNETNNNISNNGYLDKSVQNKYVSTVGAQNINNGSQLIGTAASQVSKPYKMNIFASFINKILDKINPDINKNLDKKMGNYDPYNIDQIKQPKIYTGELISEKSSVNQNKNLISNQINQNSNNNINLKTNIKKTDKTEALENTTKKELLIQTPNDSIQENQQGKILQNPSLTTSKPNDLKSPISNNQLNKVSNKNESNIDINDKQSQSTNKKEIDKKSKTSTSSINKFPFQPLKDIIPSPKSKLSRSITFPNTNKNIATPNDNYLVSHLGEYLKKEVDDNNNQKNKGFRFCSELSQAGKDANGMLKTNQDTSLISLSVGGVVGFNIFGVLDGHGLHGHFVSKFFKDYFIKNMYNYTGILRQTKGIITAEDIYNELKNNSFSYIIELFNKADLELTKQNTFDYNISGTTCNLIFQFNKHLICFSVGDSRCIIVYDKGDSSNKGILPLSTDHKPNLPGEIERIQLSGGEVETMRDIYGNNLGPARVYKRGCDFPGLAMSRSLGDFQAKEVGVISSPQVIEYDINASTKFLIVCSDGVWEFVTNEQVRDIGNLFYVRNDAANFCIELVRFAMIVWEQLDVVRDDITVVSVFF